MSTLSHIVDDKLPISQDFKSLREEGLAFIQEYIGDEWTNLNASDPGVTVLDQVCYALTELGYCNDFPVKDILTLPNGKLQVKDQFYLPENILTTSPVTLQDYIKYIVAGVSEVKNVIIAPASDVSSSGCDTYQAYLLIDESVSDPDAVCHTVFLYLNKCRNIGELFLMPVPLVRLPYFISGTIEIENEVDLSNILTGIVTNANSYILPAVVQSGYQQLVQSGLDINSIFNGPLLQNGWIPGDHFGEKKNQLSIIELTGLIVAISGVQSVSGLNFYNSSPKCNELTSGSNEVLVIDLVKSIEEGLKIVCRGKEISSQKLNTMLVKPKPLHNIQLGASFRLQTDVPVGKFRDINHYYSIQNTFPETFAVGANAVVSNATNFQIAQSRQLKGYLTLFDQVLANQFSQLANIGTLFSFKNASTGAPSDEKEFYAVKDNYEKAHPEYPVPYRIFSPTYFYQSLYDIPHIRPLLKDNDTFKFSTGIESERELEYNSWLAYKHDPYNPYMRGMMELMEEAGDNLLRRNDILDHLLARHGESPMLIDMLIDGSLYAGDSATDRVIFKSLYLQNLGWLSYYRQKAYNYLGASKISNTISDVPVELSRHTHGRDQRDFIFNSDKINHQEELTEQDFVDYSAVELKLSLLFGLKNQYKDFIANNYHDTKESDNIKLALWMMQQRKGVVFIEMDLLLQCATFELVITANKESGPYQKINESLNYDQLIAITQTFQHNDLEELNGQFQKGAFSICGSAYRLVAATNRTNQFYKEISGTDYYFTVWIQYGGGISQLNEINFENNPVFNHRVEVILPAFIPQFNTPAFKNRLNLFLQNELPVQITYGCHFVDADLLKQLIPVFAGWHNTLVYDSDNQLADGGINNDDAVLAELINKINASANA